MGRCSPAPENMKTKKVEFQPPPGVVPEGVGVGDEFDLVTTYRVKPGGTICAVVIGEVQMPGYNEDSRGHDNYASEAKAMTDSASQGGY